MLWSCFRWIIIIIIMSSFYNYFLYWLTKVYTGVYMLLLPTSCYAKLHTKIFYKLPLNSWNMFFERLQSYLRGLVFTSWRGQRRPSIGQWKEDVTPNQHNRVVHDDKEYGCVSAILLPSYCCIATVILPYYCRTTAVLLLYYYYL